MKNQIIIFLCLFFFSVIGICVIEILHLTKTVDIFFVGYLSSCFSMGLYGMLK